MPTKSELCKNCGECCQFFVVMIRKPDPFMINDTREWFKARGIQIIRETKREWRLKIPLPCPHLDRYIESWNNNGLMCAGNSKFSCNIYDERPNVCRIFDGRLQDSRDGLNCLWKTEKIEEEKKNAEPV